MPFTLKPPVKRLFKILRNQLLGSLDPLLVPTYFWGIFLTAVFMFWFGLAWLGLYGITRNKQVWRAGDDLFFGLFLLFVHFADATSSVWKIVCFKLHWEELMKD
jgi:hypothetical protein